LPNYPYTGVTGKLKTLLQKIRGSGIPPKLTPAYLKGLGFTSSNDVSLISVLKFISLVDGSNVPTPIWSEYRGKHHRAVLGRAIKQGYAELFAVYPDANERSTADITHVFSTSSSAGEQVVSKTVSTFKALVDEADFAPANSEADAQTSLEASTLHVAAAAHAPLSPRAGGPSPHPAVHIVSIGVQI
jgi:Family of unknown function (DUF5343)